MASTTFENVSFRKGYDKWLRNIKAVATEVGMELMKFRKQDKDIVFSFINSLLSDSFINPSVFDSLAHAYAKEYNNNSGKYVDFSPKNIPENLLSNLKLVEHQFHVILVLEFQ